MAARSTVVTVPDAWIRGIAVAGAVIGLGLSFVVGPLVAWLVGLIGEVPGPVRIASELPLVWAIPVLTLAGLGVGIYVGRTWRSEVGRITVSIDGVDVQREGVGQRVSGERIASAFSDGQDLVVVDDRTRERLRVPIEQMLVGRVERAFTDAGLRWAGRADPRDLDFVIWSDGSDPLDDHAHGLLRTRQRALADGRDGAAADARDELREHGVAVRDRRGAQQYRLTS